MGLKVNDEQFIKMLKQVASGYWDIINYNFNRGSEYIVTFAEEANRSHEERVRVSKRMADAVLSFALEPIELAADHEAELSRQSK
jgi:hypothetical protein